MMSHLSHLSRLSRLTHIWFDVPLSHLSHLRQVIDSTGGGGSKHTQTGKMGHRVGVYARARGCCPSCESAGAGVFSGAASNNLNISCECHMGRPMIKVPESNLISISVFEMKAAKLFANRVRVFRWSDGSRVRIKGGSDEVMFDGARIEVTYSRLASGGMRPWFECPSCGVRCGRLFLAMTWQCRTCAQVAYRSEHDRPGTGTQLTRIDARLNEGRWPYLARKLLERRQRVDQRRRMMK